MYDSYDGRMPQATVTLPQPDSKILGPSHPFVNAVSHKRLLDYLKYRLSAGKKTRDSRINRFAEIDKQVAGWMKLSDDDKKRQRETSRTGIPKQIDVNLPLTWVHLDDLMTYYAQTFAPNRGMFYHSGNSNETEDASQIVSLMNNHAIYAGYYRETLLGIYSLLKYNFGGFYVNWAKDFGPKITRSQDGIDSVENQLRWAGNRMEAIDPYNFLPDSSVHPNKLHCDGEFAAMVTTCSEYWLQKKASQGLFFNTQAPEKYTQSNDRNVYEYYVSPPEEALMEQDESTGTDWRAVLTEGRSRSWGSGVELTTIHIHLNPTEFGLIPGTQQQKNARSRYEQWRFTIMGGQRIIDATYMNNIHGWLPTYTGVLNDDVMGTSQKSTAEIINPLQRFASGLMNTHVKGTRKNLYGLTVYDSSIVDLSQIQDGDVAARVPIKKEAAGKNVQEAIWQTNTNLDTKQTMNDLQGVMDIINQFFPTQALPSQIAGIDRAVKDQVAAVQQGVNRRQQKGGRLMDDTLFRNVRTGMYYNIIQYQEDASEITDFYSGKVIKIDLNRLRNTDLPFVIGQGLKAIDRQAAAQNMRELIFTIIQAPQVTQPRPDGSYIDIMPMINYWIAMTDIDFDMTKAIIQPQTQQPPAGEQGGATAGQPADPAAAAAGITPATAPSALAGPIYGGTA